MPTPLYIGFSSVDRQGINTALTNIDLIKADLRNALLVPIRSVVGYPRYGSVIPLLPFELDSPTGGLVSVLVENARDQISNDPRVTIQNIDLNNDIATHTVTLTISLFFVEFNMTDSLVLNFSTETR
jgi:phage baseplate assembly protein W